MLSRIRFVWLLRQKVDDAELNERQFDGFAAQTEQIGLARPGDFLNISISITLCDLGERIEIVHGPGEALPAGRDLDLVVSIGVLQFIEDPQPILRAARAALRPGGRVIVWVYGREGNAAYLALLRALRAVTPRLPHALLSALCSGLNVGLDVYLFACRFLRLPLRDYLRNTLARVSREKRKLTIYDQLNPTYVRFYERAEVREMLERAGFTDVALHHRRGYSWTALGVKPVA